MTESIATRVESETADELEKVAEDRDSTVSGVAADVLDEWAADGELSGDVEVLDADDDMEMMKLRSRIDQLRDHVETLRDIQSTIATNADGVDLKPWVSKGIHEEGKTIAEVDPDNYPDRKYDIRMR